MKQLLGFALLSMLLVGCSQFKTSKTVAPVTLQNDEYSEDIQSTDEPSDVQKMATSASRQMLLGKWYGIRKTANGEQKEWLTERSADGTYRTDFRSIAANGSVRSQAEVGFWGVSGDIYFRIFRGWVTIEGMKPADPTIADHYDAYKIEELDNSYFSYEHKARGKKYTVRKMPSDFRLPITVKSDENEPLTFSY